MALSGAEAARYSRQIILPEIGVAGQEKLRESRVLIIGMGGLGSPAALYLAAAGVGTLGLADFDKVEVHNLQRQIIHDEASQGTSKLESAARRLRALDPSIRLNLHPEGVTDANAIELFGQYDIIVDGTDNFPTRYRNNDAAVLARKPLVYGSIYQFEGQVSIFDPASGGPCYRCLFPEMPAPGEVPNCDEAGVFGALCGVVGSFQALETIKYLTGAGESLRGRLLAIDALTLRVRTINLKRHDDCPVCGKHPTITTIEPKRYDWSCQVPAPDATSDDMAGELPLEISVAQAHSLLQQPEADRPMLLDVREDHELAICQIPGNHHIPMGEIGLRQKELPTDRPIVVQCHHGGRSLRVAQALRNAGYEATSMRGGIEEWAVEYDLSMRRY
ncbi:MAG: molybdopterin-synthase adenylyltransferase MoeB [Verrucomicrobiota bacterium JB022]|nr:molybdopterin-synthase adenylyltransferase MoeB [Verrucomicrobiota bacterium JB022]